MKRILFLLLGVFVLFNANGSNIQDIIENNDINKVIVYENRFDKLIDLAESYMETNPEFAFNCAYKAHEISKQTKNTKQLLKSNIMMGDIFNNSGAHVNAIQYYENAIDEMLLCNDYESIYKMYMKIANMYNDFDQKLAVESIEKAIEYANKYQNMDAIMEANLASGFINLRQTDYISALASFDVVLENGNDDVNVDYIIEAMTSKAVIFMRLNQFEEAMALLDSSLYLCDNNSNDVFRMLNYGYMAEIYDSIQDISNAKEYYIKAIELAYNKREYEHCGEYMFSLGMLERKIDSINSAIKVLRILCDSTEIYKWFGISYRSYYELSRCYAEIEDYEAAYNLFNKYDVLYDSAIVSKQKKRIEEIYTGYKSLGVEELKLKELEDINLRKSKNSRTILYVSTIVLSLIFITFIILYSRNKIIYYKNQETVYEQQLKIDKIESELMEMQMKKNKDMLMNLALHLKSYMEYIIPIKNELKEILDSSETDNKNKIKNVYMSIQNNTLLFNNAENLNAQINDIYKDFLDKLEEKYPDLTKSEKRLCAMLYIDMSSKEIATITNTTLRTVETSRYRLRKKFNLSRDEDMVGFLRNI